ncbi:Acetyltransferase (GNAT) family protein [Gimesia panareensis]|uniref:Acetyltransferase (GNAT) family protein n=1 Tax=Gimesia panareensis TaxID=2527978 RepID=A0A518FPY0_9PLAN|nr:GNAT family N-acetyltransferase [Gimesia panareensis]QDV18398.1 Acetyltransferase (GNAT) family protein [Gimesia panareensis]
MQVPDLETDRLLVRPLTAADLQRAFEIIDRDWIGSAVSDDPIAMSKRKDWLNWTVLGYQQQSQLGNPPYGDRAIFLKSEKQLIGLCGLVPSFAPFGRIIDGCGDGFHSPEVGLFYCIDSRYRQQGYASEAARALIEFAFNEMQVRRMVATTEQDNQASMAVMQRLGFVLHFNSEPGWPEVVGCLSR